VAAASQTAEPGAGIKVIRSPMVGTFYRAPSPDSSNFVEEGAHITEDSVLCIIEAMKVMNEIKAECAGELVKILVANGEAVEYGEPLFHVRTA
jgi:acetyl-CoA carboxylase biotin carboxyl carrier protein